MIGKENASRIRLLAACCAPPWLLRSAPSRKATGGSDETAFAMHQANLQRAIEVTTHGSEWLATRIDDIGANSVMATILYKSDVGGSQAKMDAIALVAAILQEIVASGGHPAADASFIGVSAQQDSSCERTGVAIVRPYGSAIYDYNTNQIIFQSAELGRSPMRPVRLYFSAETRDAKASRLGSARQTSPRHGTAAEQP